MRCVANCAPRGRVQTGGAIKLRGASLRGVKQIVFMGARGKRDDVSVRVRPNSDSAIRVKVPFGAQSGPVSAVAAKGVRSQASKPVTSVPAPEPVPSAELTPVSGPAQPGAPRLETATNLARLLVGGPAISFSYRLADDAPARIALTLVRLNDGASVQTWEAPSVAPGEVQQIQWDGRVGGAPAPEGRYAFRLVATGARGAEARNAALDDPQRDAFELSHNVFPVPGAHDYGGDGARFGSGRSGHSHQGHDVFAACGSKLVAARGGVVKARRYHSAAGHYLVIDADDSGVDYAYMHLVQASPFAEGDRVQTGQQIGLVGDSGNARGCHLHFELWAAPGWYTGGSPFDPLPDLQAWDAYS